MLNSSNSRCVKLHDKQNCHDLLHFMHAVTSMMPNCQAVPHLTASCMQ